MRAEAKPQKVQSGNSIQMVARDAPANSFAPRYPTNAASNMKSKTRDAFDSQLQRRPEERP